MFVPIAGSPVDASLVLTTACLCCCKAGAVIALGTLPNRCDTSHKCPGDEVVFAGCRMFPATKSMAGNFEDF